MTLYVSSDVKDTDFTVKLIDVLPDGTAYNIDENIQRVRYREGYDKPPVWMEKGKVYKVDASSPCKPATTSRPGEEFRIEVSSSNFPRFDRNLNTGGNNYDEDKGSSCPQRGPSLGAISLQPYPQCRKALAQHRRLRIWVRSEC